MPLCGESALGDIASILRDCLPLENYKKLKDVHAGVKWIKIKRILLHYFGSVLIFIHVKYGMINRIYPSLWVYEMSTTKSSPLTHFTPNFIHLK